MTTLEKIKAEIEQIKPWDLPCDKRTPEHIRDMALEIIDKYAEQEPMEKTLNGVFLKLSELGIQDIFCAEEIYRLIHITYEMGFNTGFNEAKSEQEPKCPCDLCVFNPPSSCDGKPCTMCPAERRAE